MRAVTVSDPDAGVESMTLTEIDHPHAAENDVVVEVHAAGFTPGELTWPGTWHDRNGHDRAPSVPGHELAGVVVELGYGTTGLTVGQRVFGLTDWTRDGSLAEYTAVEARNLAPLPASVDFVTAAAMPISGLTAWQGLITHARLEAGQRVLIHGAAGAVGSIAVQVARELGAVVVGAGRARDRDAVLGLGAEAFVDLASDDVDSLQSIGEVDVVFDVLGGEVFERSLAVLRPRGRIVTIPAPPPRQPADGDAIFFVVEPNRAELVELARRLHDGRLRPMIGEVRPLADAVAAFAPGHRVPGKTIITVAGDGSSERARR
jgi:NADPH:quinone reductase-like Zn-dependent oxidoreductase